MGARRDRSCAALDRPWSRTPPARAARELIVCGVLGALMDGWTRRRVTGRERLAKLERPAILVATHASHMDTPLILRSLPGAWRRRTAVAAAADYFYASRRLAALVSLAFGTVPVRRDGHALGADGSAHLDGLIARGFSLVVFAEGTRSRDGSVGRLRTGAAVLAQRHGLPIVPVAVTGTHAAMPPGARWMHRDGGRRRPVGVTFCAPVVPAEGEHRRDVMERVRASLAQAGAATGERPRARHPEPAPH